MSKCICSQGAFPCKFRFHLCTLKAGYSALWRKLFNQLSRFLGQLWKVYWFRQKRLALFNQKRLWMWVPNPLWSEKVAGGSLKVRKCPHRIRKRIWRAKLADESFFFHWFQLEHILQQTLTCCLELSCTFLLFLSQLGAARITQPSHLILI